MLLCSAVVIKYVIDGCGEFTKITQSHPRWHRLYKISWRICVELIGSKPIEYQTRTKHALSEYLFAVTYNTVNLDCSLTLPKYFPQNVYQLLVQDMVHSTIYRSAEYKPLSTTQIYTHYFISSWKEHLENGSSSEYSAKCLTGPYEMIQLHLSHSISLMINQG